MSADRAKPSRRGRCRWHRALCVGLLAPLIVGAEPAATKPEGLFITIAGPVTRAVRHRVQSRVRRALRQGVDTIVFDIRPARNEFGPCRELATYVAGISGATTVAFIPQPIRTHTVLLALACKEIVMAADATIGEAGADERALIPLSVRSAYTEVAKSQGHAPAIALAMLDKSLALYEVDVAVSGKMFVLADELERVQAKEKPLRKPEVVVPAGDPAVFTAAVARQRLGLCRHVLADRADVAKQYGLSLRVAQEDVLAGRKPRAVVIRLEGEIDPMQAQFVRRRMRRAVSELNANLIIFEVTSPGGMLGPSEDLADELLDLSASGGVKTIAYVPLKAMSGAAWFCLACNEIVMRESASLGDVGVIFLDPSTGQFRYAEEKLVSHVRKRLRAMAEKNGYPPVLAEAMTGKDDEVMRITNRRGTMRYIHPDDYDALPDKAQWDRGPIVKRKGSFFTMTGQEAVAFGFCSGLVEGLPDVLGTYGLQIKDVTIIGRNWVDDFIVVLNSSFITGLLFAAGLLGLYLELQMPGFGVPGVLSIISFSLFFWSKYAAGSASALEIVLFVVGMLLLALEIFVVPGFGVTGVAGILCMLSAIVLAMNTFILPTTGAEMTRFGSAIWTLTLSMVAFVGLAMAAARFLPSAPVFSRIVLIPPTHDQVVPAPERARAEVGETGVVTTTLRPAGKARFGDRLVDVVAEGEFLDAHTRVRVVGVHGIRVVVKKA